MERVQRVGMERGKKAAEIRHMEALSRMKKRMLVAMGWFLMALLLLPVGAMAQATQDVKIKVTNRVNRKTTPVKDAKVTIVDANGEKHEGTTKDDGEAIVEGVPVPPAGTVTVESGATVVTAALKVNESGKVSPSTINLASAKSVEVTVVDAVTGNGIPGATVTIGAQNAETKSQGKAMLNLMRGTFPVSVTANGYAVSTVTRPIKRFDAQKPLLDAIKLTPVRGVTIKVVNGSSPVSGVTVKIVDAKGKEYKGTAGPTGEAVVKNVPVPIKENGTVTVEQSGQVVMTAPVKVNEAGTAESDNIDISQAKAVVVTVVDAKTKQGIEGATVAVGAQVVTTKGSAGKVTLNLLGGTIADPVQYRMVAKKEGYADSTVMRKVDHNGIANPNTIKLTPVRDVTITVTDNGAGVSGATVTIVDENGKEYKKTTGSDGNAVMPKVLAPTDGTLTVSAGDKEVSVPVTVDEDGNANLNTIDIQKIVPVIMTVVDEWAVPIPNGTVTVAAKKADIGSDGKVTLNLLGGMGIQYQMVAKGPAVYAVTSETVLVNADGTADPNTIELKQNERVTITVVNNDQPEDGATVTIVDAKGNEYKETTGSNGKADVPKMAGPTEWTVTVEKGWKVVTVPVKVAKDGKLEPDRIDIAKPRGVEVTVIDAVTGEGIEGAKVTVGAQTVTADGNGKVTLNLQEGVKIQYQVVTTADGYANSTVKRRVKAYNGSTLTLGGIELMSLAGVTIKVTDNGAKVPGATVTIVDVKGKEYKGMTLNDGMAVVQKVPVLTEGTVTVEKDGKQVTGPVKVKGDGKAEPDNIDISQAKAVVVTVVDSAARTYGLGDRFGTTVTVGAQVAKAGDYYGKVTLNLLGGTGVKYRMKAKASTYVDRTVAVSVNDEGIADPDTIELKYFIEVPITVRNNGNALIGADVTIVDENGKSYTAKTDEDGIAKVPGVPAPTEGTVTVRTTDIVVTVPVTIDGWGHATPATIDIEEGNTPGVNVIEAKEVEVTVVDPGTKNVIEGATVTVGAQTVTTDDRGKVKLNLQIKKKGYPVLAKAEGYEANTVKVSVDAEGKAEPDTIKLTVLWEVEFDATEGRFANGRRWRIVPVAHRKSIQKSNVEEPTREGYTFVGWLLNNDSYDLTSEVKGDIKLTARWVAKHTVTLDYNDGKTPVEKQEVEDGKAASRPASDPTRDGYAFKGWYQDGATAPYDFGTAVTQDITLKARWVAKHTVTFDYNDGKTAPVKQEVEDGKTASKPADPTRDGYTFVEWQLNGVAYNFDDPVNADIMLTALWRQSQAKTYTVTVKTQLADGTAVAGATVGIGAQAPATTGPDGQVTAQLPNGPYSVAVQKAGYEETGRTPAGLTVDGQDVTLTVTLKPIETPNPKAATATLKLTVIGEDGQPLKETKVTIGGEKYTTDAKGKVTLQAVPVGTSTVPVAKEGYYPASVDVTIKENETTEATVKLVKVPAGTTPSTPTLHTVTVKVELAGATGTPATPVAGATVRIDTQVPATTGPDGQVTIQLPDGAYPVAVQKAGYKEEARTPVGLTVDGQAVGASIEITITLVPSVLDIGLDALYIFEKDTYTFKAYEGDRLLKQDVEWSVKDESVAKIDPPAEGRAVLTALKVGATTLTASYGGRQVVCAVYVLSYNRVSPVESAQLAEASCYPNPFSTVLYLKGVAQVARYEIYSPLGQLVYGAKGDGMPEYQIQCQGWADGFYLIVLTDHEGHTKVLKAVKR